MTIAPIPEVFEAELKQISSRGYQSSDPINGAFYMRNNSIYAVI